MEIGMKKFVMMVAAVLVVAIVVEGSEGFSLCNMSEDDLMTCKPAVSKPSPVDPSPECCKALSGADLTCLCSYKNSETLPFLGIDPDLAMALPSKCNLTPPASC
ncbi:hypothetical protein PVL29_009352 [Vitis rotundifolia]|uniref:Bifunctional inhibitor/plant lipid transfer protein/seed storage helical domain-containing protein n=1 Tax=Vitis rotundifolia TaxID=103349 RepID=A0AA39DXE9_VITRO|nr:hypothetical protein PVL29_009352 [Vitis rotundifolia]